MKDLIERLEASDGADPDLSGEVLRAFGWRVIGIVSADEVEIWESPGGLVTTNPPDPAGSVDDALALVPEGWRWGVRSDSGKYEAWLSLWSSEWIERTAATPALALCAAILKAREASQKD